MKKILCVCTGNTCRSPMLACLLTECARQAGIDLTVTSAGVAASPGFPASPHAVTVMASRGLALQQHQSKSIDELNLSDYDAIWCMGPQHADAVIAANAPSDRVHVCADASGGVPDPYGGDFQLYDATADVLALEAARIMESLI